jgi:hypothetical protein
MSNLSYDEWLEVESYKVDFFKGLNVWVRRRDNPNHRFTILSNMCGALWGCKDYLPYGEYKDLQSCGYTGKPVYSSAARWLKADIKRATASLPEEVS